MKSVVKIWRESKERYKNLDKKGKVASWTKIIESPVGWQGQYYVVLVELEDKTRMVGQLVESKKIKIGDRVVGVIRKLGEVEKNEVIEYGVKWKKL